MNTFKKTVIRKAIFLILASAMIACLPPHPLGASKKEEEKEESQKRGIAGRDPRAFADAAAMLAPSDLTRIDDGNAKYILADIEVSIGGGGSWSPALWAHLDRLRAAAVSDEMIGELRKIARKMKIPGNKPARATLKAARKDFEEGNRRYERGKFDQAALSYRRVLENHPGFWDAWNNLALAEMHDSNDLIALFVLSALASSNAKYTGGSINLSVCLTRLGRDEDARDVAGHLARQGDEIPMARYNMAWFENARGNYTLARDHLERVLDEFPDYTAAKWLDAVNEMESGEGIGADDLEALPADDRIHGTPTITARTVKMSDAGAYSGGTVVARIRKGTELVISEEAGDWYAFYWPVENVKRRLWIHRSSLGDPEAAGGELEQFIGTWGEKWGRTISHSGNIHIREFNGRPKVTVNGWRVWNERIENGRLIFRKKGGDSNWEFVYTVTPKEGTMELEVYRVHDDETFHGKLTK